MINKPLKKVINCGVVILSAGKSNRMKYPKPWLKYDDKFTFLSKIVDTYVKFGCNSCIVVLNKSNSSSEWHANIRVLPNKVNIVINDQLQHERYYSVRLGIKILQDPKHCFIHNVDNPFIDIDTLNKIYAERIASGYVSPTYDKTGGHPVLIGKKIISHILHSKENSMNFRDVLKPYLCKKLKMSNDIVLRNINTTEEYRHYFEQNLP